MSFERLVSAWNRFWHSPSNGLNLAICRILIVGTYVAVFFPELRSLLETLRYEDAFHDPQPLIRILCAIIDPELLRDPTFVTAAWWVTRIAGILGSIGFFTRTSLGIFATGLLYLVSLQYSFGELKPMEPLNLLFFAALPFSPAGHRLSLDSMFRSRKKCNEERAAGRTDVIWPVKLAQILLGLIYLNAALCKLSAGGLQWMNGFTMQFYLISRAVDIHYAVPVWVAQQFWLCVGVSIFTIFFEVFFITGVFFRKTLWFWLPVGIVFHIGLLYVLAGNPLFISWLVIYLAFIDFEAIVSRRLARQSGT